MPRLSPKRISSSDRAAWGLLLGISAVAAAVIADAGRDTVFRGDDWDLLLHRRGISLDELLAPHNEHLLALQVAVQNAVVAVVGPDYVALRGLLIASVVATVCVVFLFAGRRVGPWAALALTVPLLFLGSGADNLLWPTMLGVVWSLGFGTTALLLLETRSSRGNAIAALSLLAAVASSTFGLFFLGGIAIWFVLEPGRRRDLWIPGGPLLLYLLWYAEYRAGSDTADVATTLGFAIEVVAGGLSGLSGVGISSGRPLLTAGLLGLALAGLCALAIRQRAVPVPARTVGVVALPILAGLAIAWGRGEGGDPYASRYLYASALFIVLAIAELLGGWSPMRRSRVVLLPAAVIAVGVSIGFNIPLLFDNGDEHRRMSQYIRGRAGALEVTQRTVDPGLVIEPLPDMGNMTAGLYLEGLADFGESPIDGARLPGLTEEGRQAADQILVLGAPPRYRRAIPGACVGSGRAAPIEVVIRPAGIVVVPPRGGETDVGLRRYAETFQPRLAETIRRPTRIRFTRDLSARLWRAQIRSEGATVCPGGA
jgi:hypothetical protein